MKGLMAHEIPMKAQLKTHKMCPTHTSTKVDVNALEKCSMHLLIRNSSCQICLNLGQYIVHDGAC